VAPLFLMIVSVSSYPTHDGSSSARLSQAVGNIDNQNESEEINVKRALIGIATVLAIIVMAIALWLTLTDFSKYKMDIEQAVTEATGRPLSIDGDFIVEVFPPMFVAEEVTYANAEWASGEPMVSVGHLSARLDGSSLFGGPVVVEDLQLRDVTIVLETSAEGETNWTIEPEEESPAVEVQIDVDDEIPVVLASALLENITVIQRSADTEDRVMKLESMTIQTSEAQHLEAQGNGSLDGTNLSLTASLGPVDSFSSAGELTLESEIWYGNVTAVANLSRDGERLNFDVSVDPLQELGTLLETEGLPEGRAAANGALLIDGNNIGLIDVTVDTSLIEFNTSLNAVVSDARIVLDPFAVRFGESDVTGALDVDSSDGMRINGTIRSKLLDLTPFAAEEPVEGQPAEAPPAESAPGDFVLSDEPLPFDFLNAGSVDLDILIETFRNGPISLEQVEGKVVLADGVLDVDGGLAVADGGSADADFTLSSSGESADLDMEFAISDFRLRAAEGGEISTDEIPLIGLSLDIESSGNSMHTLAAGSNGKVILTQGAGKVDNRAVGMFSADIISQLFGALNPFAEKQPYSNWECTVLGLDVVDGVATINPMLAQSEKVTIVADGKIDFNDEKLDISFNTKPRRGVGVSADMFLTPFIRLGGTMSSPRMAIDKSGVLIEGGAAFLTGGISFFVKGAADRATGSADRCAAALAIANGEEVEAEQPEN
jgi:AsmA protein